MSNKKEKLYGYIGKLLFVDLTTGKTSVEELSYEDAKLFMGGPGLGAKILYERMPANTDPLGEDSIIGFVTGPLIATGALFGARYTVVCKSPVTGGWNDSNSGGLFAEKLKRSGYDAIFIKGKAPDNKPVYLFVNNGNVEIRDASDLWGSLTIETEEKLTKRHGKKIGIALVGPGGENLSNFSAIMNDNHRAAARGGTGAVMGSKNLKAIVVKGRKKVRKAHPLKMLMINLEIQLFLLKQMKNKDIDYEYFPEYGTGGTYENSVKISDVAFKNFAGYLGDGYTMEDAQRVCSQGLHKYKKGAKFHCSSCGVGCSSFMEMDTKRWGKLHTSRPEYETMAVFGSNLLNKDEESIVKVNILCNEYGFDVISAGSTIAWAMECYDNNVLTKDELDGIDLSWGNAEAIVKLMEKICKNEGIGKLLAKGSQKAADELGKGHEHLVVASGIEVPQHDPRLIYGLGRTYLVDPTPGRHVKACIEDLTISPSFDPETTLYGTGPEDLWAVINTEIMNASGMCSFPYGQANPNDSAFRNINAVTGFKYDMWDYQNLGRRLFTLRHAFNLREGIFRKDMTMSKRAWKAQPPDEGLLKDIDLDYNIMVDNLYHSLGWKLDGVPHKRALQMLGGLNKVIDNLYGEDKPKVDKTEELKSPLFYY
ncbi:MAG: aldehyde ferredoxin oxidoreductase family protein [Oscillospiraceae bacterium]|jgi:aldehyde:ferredoxin oxidoreductase|nr:aldehyde ferredoxin oxidoreductase family protein [Oscillospiraceae bacterium]